MSSYHCRFDDKDRTAASGFYDVADRLLTTNVSSGNKNSQHANLKAKLAAKEKYEDTRLRYQEIKSKNQKTPEDRKLENVLKRQLDYWKRKMDFTGENHSQGGGKGNKK